MRAEHDLRQERRGGVAEGRLPNSTIRPSRPAGSRVTSSAFQSASASMRLEMRFASGSVASWRMATTKRASGTAAGSPMPPRRLVTRMRIHAPGIAKSANQPRPFGRWLLRVVPELVREHHLLLLLRERLPEDRVPEDDAPRRPEPERVGVRLHRCRGSPSRLGAGCGRGRASTRSRRAASSSDLFFSGVVVKSRYGATKENSAAIPTNTAAPGSHQRSPSFRARPMTMSSAMQMDRNCGGEDSPVLEEPVEVARGRSGPSAAATSAPRARTGRATSHAIARPSIPRSIPVPIGPADDSRAKAAPALRVDPERDEERDLCEDPVDVEETLVPLRPLDEVGAEDRVDVDGAEARGRPERRSGRGGYAASASAAAPSATSGDPQKVSPRTGVGVDELLGFRLRLAEHGRGVRVAPGHEHRVRSRSARSSAGTSTPRFRIPSGIRAVTSAYHQPRRARTNATPPSALATMNAGMARKKRKRIVESALRCRRVDLEVDPVRARAAGEAREPPADR